MGALHTIAHDQIIAPAAHAVATGAVMASIVGLLTPTVTLVSLLLATVWYGITIWETATFQKFVAWVKSKFSKS